MSAIKRFKIDHPIPCKTMPLDVGIIHLVGIGGIGMSGIAEILHNLGYQVAGSDMSENANVERLRKLGIKVHIGHKPENVEGISVLVKSTAVSFANPEIIAARENSIPVIRRSEMLAEIAGLKATIAVAGTHGKTTTTSLVAKILDTSEMDPTVINGGIINAYGTNARLGQGDWLVAEADESDGTFIKIPADIGIITNIDPEHIDYWGDFDKLKQAFVTFIENLPFYGCVVVCIDNPIVRELVKTIKDRRVITYGIESEDADIKAINISSEGGKSVFDVKISHRSHDEKNNILKSISVSIPGQHNILNSLAAIGVALELKISDDNIVKSLADFAGVKRRFTKTGEVNGVTIIDDYGHHPTEIEATLAAARNIQDKNKIIAVFQPHRYSRVEELFQEFGKCFSDADVVIVSDIHAAGEKSIEGVSKEAIEELLKKNGVDVHVLPSPDKLASMVKDLAGEGDMVVCLGAGTVTKWANDLPGELESLS